MNGWLNPLFLYSTICFISLFGSDALAQNVQRLRTEIEKIIRYETEISFENTPGLLVGIIDGDSTYILSFGSLYLDTLVPPDENDVFGLGDLTQVFTAYAFHQLMQKGVIDGMSSPNTFLPDTLKNPTADSITLIHLLTHTSGLPRLPFGIGLGKSAGDHIFATYPLPSLITYFKNFDFVMVERGVYSYSPTGYAVLGLFFNQNFPWREKLAEYPAIELFKALGMHQSCYEISPYCQPVPGYDKAGMPVEEKDYDAFRHAMGLKSSMHDLLIFTKHLLASETGISELVQPRYPTVIEKNTWAGLGWHVIQRKRKPNIITHTGHTAGHRAAVAMVRETRTGVIILSNSPLGLNGLEFKILRMLNQDWKRKN